MMKAQLKFCPDLRACMLEDRLVPASTTMALGSIVLTTGGYVLIMSPFPVSVADPNGASASPGFLTPSAMSGSGGKAGLLPASTSSGSGGATNAPSGSKGKAAVTIIVGSGADAAGGPVIPTVTHNTIANDRANAAPKIGSESMDRSELLTPGQVYHGGVPTEVAGQRSEPDTDETPVVPLPVRFHLNRPTSSHKNTPMRGDSRQESRR
jgi:hypothetical protein